jgi:hypothetical protein
MHPKTEIEYQAQVAHAQLDAMAAEFRATLAEMHLAGLKAAKERQVELPYETWARERMNRNQTLVVESHKNGRNH